MRRAAFKMQGAVAVVALLGSGFASPVFGQTPAEIKAAIKCRKTIASQGAALVKAELGAIDKCHKTRDKGKTAVDCNQIVAADVKAKLPSSEGKAAAKIDKACGPADVDDIVLRNYLPDGDVDGNVFPALRAVVEDSSAGLLGAPGLTGTKAEKAKIKCHAALAGERTKIINEVVKGALKCQGDQDKLADQASDFASLAADCATPAPKPNHGEKITKACGPAVGTDGTQVGSCGALPDCLLNDARATGETLASAIFGQPAVCGNGVPEPGEGCDDGDLTSGDGCDANCTPTGCGNGIQTAGEACDDGNDLDTDQCVGACQVATCGDGFVETGREECGDAPTEACTNPNELVCLVSQCSPPVGERHLKVALVIPAGKSVAAIRTRVDYREDKVRILGVGDSDDVKARVVFDPAIAPILGTNVRIDRDFRLDVDATFSTPAAAGPFFDVTLETCDAATSIDEYACRVIEAFDGNLEDLTSEVTCTVALP